MASPPAPGPPRLRRSLHFVPGANPKMLRKALELPADGLILDLEDAVTPENKDRAREVIAEWLSSVDFGRRERVVRINQLGTPWGVADLEVTMRAPPDAYLVPKIGSRQELLEIDAHLTRLESERGHPENAVRLIVLATETPEGLLNIRELARAPRVDALTWGAEDLAVAIGARRNRNRDGSYLEIFRYARHMGLLSATAAGIQPIDGVWADFRDLEGLRRESLEAAEMGFTGKLTIHPAQIEVVNAAFTPSPEEVAESRELLEAFEENRRAGRMAFSFKGQMVDAPHFARARRILERADQVRSASAGSPA
jgi:citrate lyase subunit beta/citryl-CoA lyase